MRWMLAALVAVSCWLLGAQGASAATLSKSGSVITYTADPGEENELRYTDAGANLSFDEQGSVGITAVPPCAGGGLAAATCPEVGTTRVVIDLGDDNDSGNSDPPHIVQPMTLSGGEGFDELTGGSGADLVDGGPGRDEPRGGAGADTVRGGDGGDLLTSAESGDVVFGDGGNDAFVVDGGNVDFFGGPGLDVLIVTGGSAPVQVPLSLDDLRNDGVAPNQVNIHSDIEGIDADFLLGPTLASLALTGSDGANTLRGGLGNDAIDGRGGFDLLSGGGGADQVQARDGGVDQVSCGEGADSAVVDAVDVVDECEAVDRAAPPPAAPGEDAPPSVAIGLARLSRLGTDAPTSVTVAASDDRGIGRVVLMDDDRIVGEDTSAPYTFSYRPLGGDVGGTTLVAMAIDTANQTATDVRRMDVGLFRAVTRLRLDRSRDRQAPFVFRLTGSVQLPPGVTRAQGCGEGEVRLQVRRGSRSVRTRRVRLRRDCTFALRLRLTSRRGLGTGRLSVRATFLGNDVLRSGSAPARAIRAG